MDQCLKVAVKWEQNKYKFVINILQVNKQIKHSTLRLEMDQSTVKKLNPEISVQNQRIQFKKVQTDVGVMKNRVMLLQHQLQKQKESIKKHKNLTKQAIQKKIEVNKIHSYKSKDGNEEINKIQELRQRNKSLRESHKQQLQNIQKAIYLVKLDDARQLKNISLEHRRKIQEMDREFHQNQKQKKKKIAEDSSKAKQRYMQYWKQKIGNLYLQQAQNVMQISKKKEDKQKQFEELQKQQIKLMEEINRYHSQHVQSKKQYLAALSLPVKDVAQAMGQSPQRYRTNRSTLDMSEKVQNNKSTLSIRQSQSMKKGIKMPNTSVNEAKLKIILKQLKKIDRSQTYSSR